MRVPKSPAATLWLRLFPLRRLSSLIIYHALLLSFLLCVLSAAFVSTNRKQKRKREKWVSIIMCLAGLWTPSQRPSVSFHRVAPGRGLLSPWGRPHRPQYLSASSAPQNWQYTIVSGPLAAKSNKRQKMKCKAIGESERQNGQRPMVAELACAPLPHRRF